MTPILALTASLLLLTPTHSLEGPGRDPCKTTENGFGLTCSNITPDFFTSSMFFSLKDDIIGEVKRFEIRQSNVTTLLKGSFKYLRHLSYLVAPNVSLTNIDRGAFEGLGNLKMVDLSFNQLEEMPVRAFKDTPISHLTLEGNLRIRIPTNGPVLEAKRLRSLVLRRCNLQHLPGSAFTEVPGLSYLDLSGNGLEMLPRSVLAPLEHLDYIDLSDNKFSKIDFKVFTSIPSFPDLPTSVVLAGNPWSCDCTITGLIDWVATEGGTRTNVVTRSRLRKMTVCGEPEDLRGISWTDPRLRQRLLECAQLRKV